VDPAIFNLVDMTDIWNKLQDELGQEGKKTAVRHYQNILQLHASFWANADTLHVAVVVPIMRTEATIFAAYEVRIPPVLAGNRLAYLQLDEEVLLVYRATGTIAHTGNMDKCIEVDATRYCNMAYVLKDKAEPSCQGAVWRSEWSEATQRCPIRMVRVRATVWALEKDEFWVVLPNTTECTFTCRTEPPQTRQLEGQHRVRLGEKCGMSSMHFSLRPATQADGRKITIRQAVVNFTDWQTAMPEEKIFRATPISNNDYQRRATAQLEKGESGQNWPLIILATVLAILGVGIVAAGSAAFMFRRRIAMELVAATVAPRATEETATLVPRTTEETEGKKEMATKREGNEQRSQARPRPMTLEEGIPMGQVNKKERLAFDGLENLKRFMLRPQHSMGDGYARRPCNNCWDGKTLRDTDEGVLSTYCTGCATLNEPFASEETKMEVWDGAKEMAILLPQELRPKNWAGASRKERQYVSYYFKDGLGQNRRPVPPGEDLSEDDVLGCVKG
jgi:hypothetical protein